MRLPRGCVVIKKAISAPSFNAAGFQRGTLIVAGKASFYLRWSQDRAVDYGQRGKVLISLENNRYLIPDLEKLTPSERTEFQRYIYW